MFKSDWGIYCWGTVTETWLNPCSSLSLSDRLSLPSRCRQSTWQEHNPTGVTNTVGVQVQCLSSNSWRKKTLPPSAEQAPQKASDTTPLLHLPQVQVLTDKHMSRFLGSPTRPWVRCTFLINQPITMLDTIWNWLKNVYNITEKMA